MSKILIIAEKPSQAKALMEAVAPDSKKKDYYENDKYIICNAIGHLLEIDDSVLSEVWSNTPYFFDTNTKPIEFFRPKENTKTALNIIKNVIDNQDLSLIINACDPDVEGELIYTTIIEYTNKTKKINTPQKRLIIKNLTKGGINSQMEKLEGIGRYYGLVKRGYGRTITDFVYGINLTRTLTTKNRTKSIVGRVLTPTLKLVVERNGAYNNHTTSFKYGVNYSYEELTFENNKIIFDTKKEAEGYIATNDEFTKNIKVHNSSKNVTSNAPKLHDLASLQSWANKQAKFSPAKTLRVLQGLYDKGFISYPRTDCKYISNEQARSLQKRYNTTSIFYNIGEVTAHEGLTTTNKIPNKLTPDEDIIYKEIDTLTESNFYPSSTGTEFISFIKIGDDVFGNRCTIIEKRGYLDIYNKHTYTNVVDIKPREIDIIDILTHNVIEKKSKRPQLFTEGTLITKMKNLGNEVDDVNKKIYKEIEGIGTPATRSGIIENLKKYEYIKIVKNKIVPTESGISIIKFLELSKNPLVNLEFTATLEGKLKELEGNLVLKEYLENMYEDVIDINNKIINTENTYSQDTQTNKIIAKCPKCGKDTVIKIKGKNGIFYVCSDKSCNNFFPTWKDVTFTENEIKKLADGKLSNKHKMMSKKGTNYEAKFKITNNKLEIVFK